MPATCREQEANVNRALMRSQPTIQGMSLERRAEMTFGITLVARARGQ
jgi:hypothetical protein